MAEEQKSEEPKPAEKKADQVPGQVTPRSEKKDPKEIERQRRQAEHWQQSHPGLRRVYFVIDTELWDRFVASCCTAQKPNAVFTRMIREAVQAKAEGF
jgi:hypothetical protein